MLNYKAFTALGDLYDSFTLTKQETGPNLITVHPVAMEERIMTPAGEKYVQPKEQRQPQQNRSTT